MLKKSDIHYLVGLLTAVSHPENVEIELGDMVFDAASQKKRDIDITVTWKDLDGKITAFKGIEVKGNKRTLDETIVEQLCQKLNDMPECKNVRGLVNNLLSKALNEILRHESIQLLSVGQSQNVVIIMNINDQPYIDIDNKESRYLLSQAIIKGQVILSDDKKLKPEFKVLVKYGEKYPSSSLSS